MNRTKKQEMVVELSERLRGSENLYVTDFTGIAVKPMTELRRKLKSVGGEYVVVKNTLALRALASVELTGLEDVLDGPTAFVFTGEDPAVAAKILDEFRREHHVLKIKAGLVEGRAVGAEVVVRIAKLPARDELMAQLGGAFQAPLQGFVGALSSFLYQVVGALEALRAQRGST